MPTSVAIDIIFSGLIAFVPDAAQNPASLTAYFVEHGEHTPVLRVYGDVFLENEEGGTPCVRELGPETGWVVTCELGNTTINFGNQDAKVRRHLPESPRKKRPDDPDEYSWMDWLVRMSNVEAGVGTVKGSWSDLEQHVGARMTFGWDTARVLELDGSEAGRPVLLGFRDSNGKYSLLQQAVAEKIMFTTTIRDVPVKINLFNRDNNRATVITARCRKSKCISMEVDNSAVRSPCSDDVDGDHFRYYYDLVRNPGSGMLPYSIDDRECVEQGEKRIDLGLLSGGFQLVRPVAPQKTRQILSKFPLPGIENLSDLLNLVNVHYAVQRAFGKAAPQRVSFSKLVINMTQVQDRIVCPPVLLEP